MIYDQAHAYAYRTGTSGNPAHPISGVHEVGCGTDQRTRIWRGLRYPSTAFTFGVCCVRTHRRVYCQAGGSVGGDIVQGREGRLYPSLCCLTPASTHFPERELACHMQQPRA